MLGVGVVIFDMLLQRKTLQRCCAVRAVVMTVVVRLVFAVRVVTCAAVVVVLLGCVFGGFVGGVIGVVAVAISLVANFGLALATFVSVSRTCEIEGDVGGDRRCDQINAVARAVR